MGGATYSSMVGCAMRVSLSKGLTNHNVPQKGEGNEQWRQELQHTKKILSTKIDR